MKTKNIINSITLILFLVLGYLFISSAMIPMKYKITLSILILILLISSFWVKNKFLRGIINLLFIIAIMFMVYLNGLINNMFLNNKYDDISLIALIDSELTPNNLSAEIRFGEIDSLDPAVSKYLYSILQKDSNKLTKIDSYESEQSLINALYNNEIDVLIVKNDELHKYENADSLFKSRTSVISTLKKEDVFYSKTRIDDPVTESFIVYLSGNDTDGSIKNNSRSDVNQLMIVNPRINKIMLVSIPRDSFVKVPCVNNQKDKLTHVGNFGINCQVDTINQLLNIDINYFIRINFSSVVNIVNILGGKLNVWNPYTFKTWLNNTFEAGCITMTGEQTLEYVRERYHLPEGDKSRQEHQKIVLNAVINKSTKLENLINMGSIFEVVSKNMETNIDTELINKLISNQLDQNPNWKFESITMEGQYGSDYTYSIKSKQSVMYIHPESLEEIRINIPKFINAEIGDELSFLDEEKPVINENNSNKELSETEKKELEARMRDLMEQRTNCLLNP